MNRPNDGTDNARVLDALLEAWPDPAWSLNHRLFVTAHSRVADLRKLGWVIEAAQRPNPSVPKGKEHGYRITGPAAWLPVAERLDALFPIDDTYRRGVA